MTQVPTATGSVDSSALGRTLMHEHVFVLTSEVQQNLDTWNENERVDDAVQKLATLRAAGIETIVDPTVIGLGRYVPRVIRVARQVDLNIVLATGLYTYDTLPFYFRFRDAQSLVDMFVRDLTDGIPGTDGVRAAFLKCAIDHFGLTRDVETVLRAVARAHRVTGAPITVHTHPGKATGLDVARVFTEEGVDPSRVVLGHSGDSTDPELLAGLADFGFLLGMDRFGINGAPTFDERVGIVAELARRGYAGSMVLAHDAACHIDWMTDELLAALPDWHFLHITDDVLPALRALGVTEDQITTMLVDNPRRYFEDAGAY